jgi:hypothetical protein
MTTDENATDSKDDTVIDFAEYRLRMRAGGPAVGRPSYYLVGLTHGVRRGIAAADPDLRLRLADLIRDRYPHALVHDPVEAWYGGVPVPDGQAGLAEFHRLTGLAGGSAVCVAWLPDRESVADAVAELQVARRAGATVVAITGEADDFLVRAFASVVLPDVDAFARWVGAAAA